MIGGKQDFRMAVTSDLHLMAKTLYDDGPAFEHLIRSDDGKQTKDSTKLVRQMFLEVHQQRYDALLITGDLTYNGELASHEDLVERLKVVKNYGVPVYVLPGNHDIRRNARSYLGNEIRQVPTVDEEAFAKLYEDFGYGQAVSRDVTSLSYMVKLREDIYLICLDNCSRVSGFVQKYGEIRPDTMNWLERQLRSIKGKSCIVAGHYNLCFHNSMFQQGFIMNNKDEVADLLNRYNVKLYLSGHMHMQHVSSNFGVKEIATSPPTTWPHQYGSLRISSDGDMKYETRQIIMAPKQRNEYHDFYRKNFMMQVFKDLGPRIELTDKEIEVMAEYAADLHLAYFSGNAYQILDEKKESQARKLWLTKASDCFYHRYMESILIEEKINHNLLLL
ncbi:MAG: metallophosphoesterase [Lachnospiraceae bacterium]|nr:metallophosphoesterase [Lachnospiraceae bacterium]